MALKSFFGLVLVVATFLLVVSSAQPSAQLQLDRSGCCYYKFESPNVPILSLPRTSVRIINEENPIILNTGIPFPSTSVCEITSAEYLDNSLVWNRTWTDTMGRVQRGINAFVLTNVGISARFNSTMAPLRTLLTGRLVRLQLSCSVGVSGCLQFFVNSGLELEEKDPCPPDTTHWAAIDNPTNDVELSNPDPVYPHWVSNLPCCPFRFSYPALSVFKIQPTPTKKGAPLMLNPDNKMVYRWGASIPENEKCQGFEIDYLNQNGRWMKTWNSRRGGVDGNFTVFYSRHDSFWMADLDAATASSQIDSLSGKLIRMQIKCLSLQGCVLFTLNGGHKLTTLPPCRPGPSAPVAPPLAPPTTPVAPRPNPPFASPAPKCPVPSFPPSATTRTRPSSAKIVKKIDHSPSHSSHGMTKCPKYHARNASVHIVPPKSDANCSLNIVRFDFSCRLEAIKYVTGVKLRLWAGLLEKGARKRVCLRVTALKRSKSPDNTTLESLSISKEDEDDYNEYSDENSCSGHEKEFDRFDKRFPGAKNRASDDDSALHAVLGASYFDLDDEDSEIAISLDHSKLDLINNPVIDLSVDQCGSNGADNDEETTRSRANSKVLVRRPVALRFHSRISDINLIPQLEVSQNARLATLHSCGADEDCTNAMCIPRDDGRSGFCSCHSGHFTPACILKSRCDAQMRISPGMVDNEAPPMQVATKFECGALKIMAQSKIRSGRLSTEITFGRNTSSMCSYPGVLWFKEVNDTACVDQWHSHIPWGIARHCANWNVIEQDDHIVWTSRLFIKHQEKNCSHSTEHEFPIKVKFPKNPKSDGKVNVTSPIDFDAAIFLQQMSFDYKTSMFRGDIRFFVAMPWPYFVKSWRYVSGPRFPVRLSIDPSNKPEECLPGQARVNETLCTQRFDLEISPTPETCEITGLYVVKIEIGCRVGTNVDCPMDRPDANKTATILLNIVSERFCGVSDFAVGITGTLRSFSDQATSVPSTNFEAERPAFFRAHVVSESDLAETKITELWVSRYTAAGIARAPVALWTVMGITDAGTRAGFTIHRQGHDYVIFSFVPSTFVGADMLSSITVTASLEVKYFFESIGSVSWKRSISATQKAEHVASLATLQLTRPTHTISIRPLPAPESENTGMSRSNPQSVISQGDVAASSHLTVSVGFTGFFIFVASILLLTL